MDSAVALISQSSLKKNLPVFKVGQTVRIHQRIKEGEKERIQVFEGIIIKTNNGRGVDGTITVRKIVDGIGVERLFPIHSPNIAKIEITKQAKIRRSKLYYLRSRTGKAARLKTTLLEGQVFEPVSQEKLDEAKADKAAEESKAEEAPEVKTEAAEEKPEEAKAESPEEEAKEKAEAPAKEEKGEEKPVEAKEEPKAEETKDEEAPEEKAAEEPEADEAPKEEKKDA